MVSYVLTNCVEIIVRVTHPPELQQKIVQDGKTVMLPWLEIQVSFESFQCIRKNHFM